MSNDFSTIGAVVNLNEKSTSGAEWLVAIYYGLPAFAYLYLLTLAPIPAIITGIYIYIFINSDKK